MRSFICSGLTALMMAAAAGLPPSPAVAGEDTVATGQFTGASGHRTKGTVTIRKSEGVAVVVLESNFNLDGAPDPKLGFGNNGAYDKGSKIAHLDRLSGHQVYQVPAGIDPSAYNEFYVWCEKFNVPLGVARLE